MKKLCFLVLAFAGVDAFAATPAMTFPYGTEMTVRHRTPSAVEIDGTYQVPPVGGGMPSSDTVATFLAEAEDMDVTRAAMWPTLSASASAGQAALALRGWVNTMGQKASSVCRMNGL